MLQNSTVFLYFRIGHIPSLIRDALICLGVLLNMHNSLRKYLAITSCTFIPVFMPPVKIK